jgi:hypothetical protein
MIVENNGEFSRSFKTLVGVRQGAKTSPKLFSIYLEELLSRFDKLKYGVIMDKLKIDIIAYADDLLLISETKIDLQKSIDEVAKFGEEFEIRFNPEKTVYLVFNSSIARTAEERRRDIWQGDVLIGEERINKVSQFKYLGVELSEDSSDKPHLEKRRKAAQLALAKLKNLEILTESTGAYLKGHLYKTFILPSLLYGNETISLTNANIKTIEKSENNLIRSVYCIPKRCRTTNLKLANNLPKMSKRLKYARIEFFLRLTRNEYTSSVMKALANENCDEDFIGEIQDILNEAEYSQDTDIITQCNRFKQYQDMEHVANKKNNNTLQKIHEIFKESNGDKIKLFEL